MGNGGETVRDEYALDNLSWLVGHWEGEAFGGICEEVWQPPSGGSMVGTFKVIVNGEIGFYEIMIISSDSTGYTMNLKHFNSDLTGWEEKGEVISFPFVRAGKNQIVFDGLDYKKTGNDSIQIVVGRREEGSQLTTIHCVRKDSK
jgi:hypothetical protein